MLAFSFIVTLFISLPTSLAGADVTSCRSCTHAVAELYKQVPVLLKTTGVREGDKELALGDALPSMCSSNVFSGLEDASDMATSCKTYSRGGSAVEKALLEGKPVGDVCTTLCEGVAEGDRAPKAKAQKPKAKPAPAANAKGGKAAPRKGSVDDPAYKEALKRKARRDEQRSGASRGGRSSSSEQAPEEAAEEGAGDL
jgi:hypothetical protein